MFIATLLAIASNWKQCKCLSAGEWINKFWCIYTMELYSAIKRNKLIHITTWKSPKNKKKF